MFENKVLRRLFWPNRKEVTREWRRLLGEELMTYTPHAILFG